MGNTCQSCFSPTAVMSPSHHEGSSLPLASPQPPIIPSSPPSIPTASSSSLSIDSLKLSIQQVHPTDQIDPLITFIEYQLQRIKVSTEEASSSSHLTSVASNTSLAAQFIGFISKEAENVASTDISREMGSLALSGLNMVGEAHWLFLGLSVAAHALERCVTMKSNVSDCIELLQAIVDLAKDLKRFNEAMPEESKRLLQPVQTIVEGAVMCCDYINKGGVSRYWLATTTQAQLEKTNKSINDIRNSLGFPINLRVLQNTTDLLQSNKELHRITTKRLEESPHKLLEFEPVGIEEKVKEVKELLDMEGTEPALAVLLCGFGGVGKSTLAASVIQNLYQNHPQTCSDFKFCRVIIDDKNEDETSHIMKLQQDIIYDFGGGKQDLRNLVDGRGRLQEAMENKRCLLFIDNVVDKKYVQQLLPKNLLWFNKSENMSKQNLGKSETKLRIIITSREKNFTSIFNITCKEYDVNVFSDEKARSFLRQTILQTNGHQSSEEFGEDALINDVADACKGVPILLSVFGKHLGGDRRPGSYQEALNALSEGNPDGFAKEENLRKQLLFVYNKLEEEEQEAFLDICKYFYGWEWNLVCNILDEATVKTLQSKILINRNKSGAVTVHDVLRLMGEKEAEQTRLSNYKRLLEVIEDDEADLRNIKGISLVGNESLVTLETKHLNATSKSLRVLMIGDWVKFDGPPCNKTFQNLRYLSMGDTIDFPFHDTSKLHKLRAFFNKSKDGMNLHQLPRTLKIISHHVLDPCGHSFETLPLQSVPYLQSFIVETRMLVKLPAEFGFPASLVDLKLNCCTQLPKDISKLVHLERLTLHKCQLEFLPQGMGKLKKLKHLSMQQCTKLASLPEEIELLSSLEELSMRECVNLRELPQGFGGLSSVQNLDLTGCITLKTLPESFAELRIESLILESLLSLEELPYCIGKMPCLSHLKLIACHSLPTLPNSFVHLKCLQTLKIIDCENLVALPKDFGQLSFLSEMIVRDCPKLEELPHGFQALPVLKIFRLLDCSSLVNLPSGFGELRCLEILELRGLLITGLPDGFGNLKRLRILRVNYCSKLETLPDDFETLASLTWIEFTECDKLDGAAMERIAKLRHAYYVDIEKSAKLIERWRKMRQEDESLMVVWTEENHLEDEERKRAARLGLLCGKCVELDNTGQQLIERSASMLFEEDTAVAVIALPVHMGFHQQLPAFVEAAIGKAKTGRLRIFYVKRVKQEAETTAKEKEEEEECFRQILKSMPKGTCAVPSTDIRRHRLLTYVFFDCHGYRADNKLACCMVNITLDDENHKFVELKENFGEEDISGEVLQRSESADKESKFSNSIGNFIESVRSGEFSVTAMSSKQSQFTEFLRILKENGADHLIDSKLNQVQLDKLKSNVVGIFICDINTSEYIKLDHIYKELKSKDHNFEMIWIPLLKNEFYGLGTYTRAIQKMSWTVLPNPNLVKEEIKCPLCIIFDQEGKIVNEDALSAMMSWGVEAFPFTKIKIHQIVSTVQAESSLDFLFNNLNLVNKGGVLENKLTFLYAETPSPKLKMKFSLEQLEQLNSNVQIVYVGNLFEEKCDITTLKDVYEDVIQEMHWPKLSFEDMFTFWYRCKCVSGEMEDNLNLMIQDLKLLTKILCIEKRWLVVLDTNGVVTRSGYEIVKMCKINDEKTDEVDIKIKNGLLECLQSGKCNQIVRTFFRDININHSKHSQHPLAIEKREILGYYCNSCYSHETVTWDKQRRYRCNQCDWDLCAKCWILFVKGEIQNSHQE